MDMDQDMLAARIGDPDCNDNTQPLHSQSHIKDEGAHIEELGAEQPMMGSPALSERHTFRMVPEAVAGLTYSPEDTLNNDFFYDDEFSVPFDANLVEVCESEMLVDSMDLGGLLSASGGAAWQVPHMVRSRSDSCLYQADLDLSYDSEQDSQFSQFSHSEGGLSGSELSDLRSEPLFSPAPVYDTLPSLAEPLEDEVKDITFTSSGLSNDPSFDFPAHKDQYMFAFDRSPSKLSSEGSMTSWAQKSQQSWDSVGSRRSSNSSSSEKSMTSWGELCKKKDQTLTTWKQLVAEIDALPVDPNGPRSRSLPELKSHSKSTDESWRLTESCKELEAAQRPSSMSLFEVFQRYRSPDGLESLCNEAMVSPNSLQKLTGTWSMSPASSELLSFPVPNEPTRHMPAQVHGTPTHGTPTHGTHGLMSWSTVCNLNRTSPDNGSPVSSPGSATSMYKSGCTSSNWVFNEKPVMISASAQAGDAPLGQCHFSMQFPPPVQDSCMQTSLENIPWCDKRNKCLQTSLEYVVRCQNCGQDADQQPMDNVKLSRHADRRLTSSIHLMSGALPDLSFLNKASCQSTIVETESKEVSSVQRRPTCVSPDRRLIAAHRGRVRPLRCRRASSSDSRESSPGLMAPAVRRPRSSDSGSNSFCSSSSSGIDPGSYESTKTLPDWRGYSPGTSDYSLASDSGSECRDVRLKTFSKKISRTEVLNAKKATTTSTNVICNVCHAKCHPMKDMPPMVNSHPAYRSSTAQKSKCKQVEYLQLSPTHQRSPKRVLRQRPRWRSQSQPRPVSLLSKPLKPCLRKNAADRKAVLLKHRSWSDPSDAVTSTNQQKQTQGTVATKNEHLGQLVWTKLVNIDINPEQSECSRPIPPGKTMADPPPNSPDLEALLLCGCGQMVPPPGVDDPNTEMSRGKKTVSFSEKICYHSPHSSPHPSPKKQVAPPSPAKPRPVSGLSLVIQAAATAVASDAAPVDLDSSAEEAPNDFAVSPTTSEAPDFPYGPVPTDQKSELVYEVLGAVQSLQEHFNSPAASPNQMQMSSSMKGSRVGQLVMTKLCPALYDVVEHGLRPHLHSLFGKVKNNVWKVVENSTELGPSTRVLNQVVTELKFLSFTEPQLKFSAFVFGLLNRRQLAYWVKHLHESERLLSRHYSEDSLLWQSRGTYEQLFSNMQGSLQALAQLPFTLQYEEIVHHVEPQSPTSNLSQSEEAAPVVVKQQQVSSSQSQILSMLQPASGQSWFSKSFDRFWSPSRSVTSPDLVTPVCRSVASCEGSITTTTTTTSVSKMSAVETPAQQVEPRVAIPVIRDNTILDKDPDPDEDLLEDGVLSRLAKQVKEAAWPEKVYKSGVTEYTFDSERRPVLADGVPPVGQPKNQSSTVARSQSCNLSAVAQDSVSRTSKRWSDVHTPTERRAVFKKTWSSFGPTLINLFDKLLLPGDDDKPDTTNETSATSSDYSWNSHKVSSQQSRSVSTDAGHTVYSRKKIQHSASVDKTWYAQALCHYAATQADELSFDKGAILAVVKEVDSDWLMCRHGDYQGLVHRGCVKAAEDSQIFNLLHDDFYR